MVEVQIGTANGGGGDTDDDVGVGLDRWAGNIGDCYVVGRAVVDKNSHSGVENRGGVCETNFGLLFLLSWEGWVVMVVVKIEHWDRYIVGEREDWNLRIFSG